MTPLYANRFKGHMPEGDPRSPFFGCAGCTWPTVPPYRWFLGSQDATGVLTFLNTVGILLEVTTDLPNPRAAQWDKIGGPIVVLDAFILKNEQVSPYGYSLSGVITLPVGFAEWSVTYQEKTCNCCHPLPNVDLGSAPVLGTTGDTFAALQVEYDETLPPGGWPP